MMNWKHCPYYTKTEWVNHFVIDRGWSKTKALNTNVKVFRAIYAKKTEQQSKLTCIGWDIDIDSDTGHGFKIPCDCHVCN
jgi:hypothetical protein